MVHLKIAVSFTSAERAAEWLDREIPAWDLEGLQADARRAWDGALSAVEVAGLSDEDKKLFYTHLFHSLVQPRDRTGDADGWPLDAPCWDDHYTLWDTWKTLFPLMSIVRPDVVSGNVRSFVERLRRNGQCARMAWAGVKLLKATSRAKTRDRAVTAAGCGRFESQLSPVLMSRTAQRTPTKRMTAGMSR